MKEESYSHSDLTRRELELPSQHPNQSEEGKATKYGAEESKAELPPVQRVDYTLIPQILDTAVEKSGESSALRSTTIKTGADWVRNRQENLLTGPKRQHLNAVEVKKEKNKAFDLLDALSSSGFLLNIPSCMWSLPLLTALTRM
eukprot:1146196_1